MREEAPKTYQHEQTQYSKEEFEKQFNNFHLVFMIDDPKYMSDVKKVLQNEKENPVLYKKFQKIKEEFKKGDRKEVIKNDKEELYYIYEVLRKKGFSNKRLGLIYW